MDSKENRSKFQDKSLKALSEQQSGLEQFSKKEVQAKEVHSREQAPSEKLQTTSQIKEEKPFEPVFTPPKKKLTESTESESKIMPESPSSDVSESSPMENQSIEQHSESQKFEPEDRSFHRTYDEPVDSTNSVNEHSYHSTSKHDTSVSTDTTDSKYFRQEQSASSLRNHDESTRFESKPVTEQSGFQNAKHFSETKVTPAHTEQSRAGYMGRYTMPRRNQTSFTTRPTVGQQHSSSSNTRSTSASSFSARTSSSYDSKAVSRQSTRDKNNGYRNLYSHSIAGKLDKQQLKLQRYSGKEKQLQLNFTRQENPEGRLHTTASITWGDKSEKYENKGIMHRIASQKYRFTGDVPKLHNIHPVSFQGKTVKAAAIAGSAVLKGTLTAAVSLESAGMKLSESYRRKDLEKQEHILGKDNRYENSGVLHRSINFVHRKVGNDVSVGASLSHYQPESIKGKTAKVAVLTGYKLAKAAFYVGLSAETKLTGGNEQFQFRMTRQQGDDGKFHTKVNIVRGEKQYKLKNKGVLHRLVNQRYRFTGDVPSWNKKINTSLDKWQPKTMKGITAKSLVKIGKVTVQKTGSAVVKTGLTAESGILALGDAVKNKALLAAKQNAYKYRNEAQDDVHRGAFAASKIAIDAGLGLRNHFKEKKQHKLHKARYRLQKYSAIELKLQKQPVLKQNKRDIKAKKTLQKINKLSYQQKMKKLKGQAVIYKGSKSNEAIQRIQKRKKIQYKEQKQKYKLEGKVLKNHRKQEKLELKFSKKKLKNLKSISRLSTPMALILRPERYTMRRIGASAYQKAINADSTNDFIKVVDAGKKGLVDKAAKQLKPSKLIDKKQKKNSKLQEKRTKKKSKLKKQESRLKNKQRSNTTKKQGKKAKQSIGKKLKQFVKNVYEKEAKWFLASLLFPLMVIVLTITLILTIFTSMFTQSGFTLGTYTAQDQTLSDAEEYYTKLASDLNREACKLAQSKLPWDWRNTLLSLSKESLLNIRNLKDDPTEWYWGRSSEFDYDPVWDFDPWQLWSFLCAYNYDFSTDSNGSNDIKFWKFNGKMEDLLDEIFEEEYEFVYRYDNGSRWEERWDYAFATSSGSRFRCIQNNLGWDDKHNVIGTIEVGSASGDLSNFVRKKVDSSTGRVTYLICYSLSNLEILNANDEYSATGWYVMDEGATVVAPCGNRYDGMYEWNNYKGWGYYDVTGTWQNRDEGWFSWYMPGTDVKLKNTPIASIAPTDGTKMGFNMSQEGLYTFYQKYEWVTDCRLYFNIKQKKSFEQILLDRLGSLSYSDQRLQYYNLLVGKDTDTEPLYGNHQTYKNIFNGETFKSYMHDGNILNWYGYDMQGWFVQHCEIAKYEYTDYSEGGIPPTYKGIHRGIDVSYPSNADIYSPIEGCKIDSYNSSEHVVILLKKSLNYWYDGKAGNGKNRDTKIYITNVTLKSGYSEGSVLKAGEAFATTTGDRKCMRGVEHGIRDTIQSGLPYDYVHVAAYIDTDGYGWNYVDPILLFY